MFKTHLNNHIPAWHMIMLPYKFEMYIKKNKIKFKDIEGDEYMFLVEHGFITLYVIVKNKDNILLLKAATPSILPGDYEWTWETMVLFCQASNIFINAKSHIQQ